MLDSGEMPDREDNPPTLASLRAGRGKSRSGKRSLSVPSSSDALLQTGLFAVPLEDDFALPASTPVEPVQSGKKVRAAIEQSVEHPSVTSALATERVVWTVRALVTNVRQHVETSYTDLWIEGEISNCRLAPSGHIYFTLKDGEAQLPVVLFRRQAGLLRFRPTDGVAVLVRGRISIYESRGQLQLIAETMEPRGAGALQLAFEQLKTRLLSEGLFDAGRKRQLPAFPKCIGIVTSPTGAVIRDIVSVVRRRHARLSLLVYPAMMQGVSSPGSVAAGVRWFNAHSSMVDVIILARGGGSAEDLAGFNEEGLARTIAASKLPIVSAIGHETDFTIADFVSDLRAPTPSAAAELVTAAQHRIEERVAALGVRVQRAGRFHLMRAHQGYTRLSAESVLIRLRDAVNRRSQYLDELHLSLDAGGKRRLFVAGQRLRLLIERLRYQNVNVRITATLREIEKVDQRLDVIATQIVVGCQSRLSRASTRLEALSPLAVLSRGYALVYASDGALIRAVEDTAVGHTVRARFAHGTLEAKVTKTLIDKKEDATENRKS
jgi:exodeoxyribonuclease VII large subunit